MYQAFDSVNVYNSQASWNRLGRVYTAITLESLQSHRQCIWELWTNKHAEITLLQKCVFKGKIHGYSLQEAPMMDFQQSKVVGLIKKPLVTNIAFS